jgi:hypothetical protein
LLPGLTVDTEGTTLTVTFAAPALVVEPPPVGTEKVGDAAPAALPHPDNKRLITPTNRNTTTVRFARKLILLTFILLLIFDILLNQ